MVQCKIQTPCVKMIHSSNQVILEADTTLPLIEWTRTLTDKSVHRDKVTSPTSSSSRSSSCNNTTSQEQFQHRELRPGNEAASTAHSTLLSIEPVTSLFCLDSTLLSIEPVTSLSSLLASAFSNSSNRTVSLSTDMATTLPESFSRPSAGKASRYSSSKATAPHPFQHQQTHQQQRQDPPAARTWEENDFNFNFKTRSEPMQLEKAGYTDCDLSYLVSYF